MQTVPCASLKVRVVAAGVYEGTITYGKRYLERPEVVALDPFHLPLSTRPQKFTKLKGIPGAVRDASPDAWGRRVIQAKLQRPEADIQEVEYLLNGPDDGAGNLSFGRTATPPAPRRLSIELTSWLLSPKQPRSWNRTGGFHTKCSRNSSPARAWAAQDPR